MQLLNFCVIAQTNNLTGDQDLDPSLFGIEISEWFFTLKISFELTHIFVTVISKKHLALIQKLNLIELFPWHWKTYSKISFKVLHHNRCTILCNTSINSCNVAPVIAMLIKRAHYIIWAENSINTCGHGLHIPCWQM